MDDVWRTFVESERWTSAKERGRALWAEFVATGNPRNYGEEHSSSPDGPSAALYECIDYHQPFPRALLDHIRRRNARPEVSSPPAESPGAGDGHEEHDAMFQAERARQHMMGTVNAIVERVTRVEAPGRNSIVRWCLHVLIAAAVALVAFGVTAASESIGEWRLRTLENIIEHRFGAHSAAGYVVGFLFWTSASAAIVAVGAAAIYIEPAAGGSGIPDVMAFLNGVMRPKVVNLKTFVAKSVSAVCAVSGGLPVGMEAPLVHLGAIVGAGVTQGRSRTLNCKTALFQSYRTNKDRRDFITAGAACGVSAAFGAPIGGLLFVMEEVSSFWDHTNSGQVFLATMLTFTFNAILHSLGAGRDVSPNAYVLFEVSIRIPLNVTAIVPAMVLGGLCGLVASAFTKVNLMIIKWRRRVIRPHTLRRVLEPVLVVVVFAAVCFWLAVLSPCAHDVAPSADPDAASSAIVHWQTENATVMNRIGCPTAGTFSPLGTLNMGLGKATIRHLFTRRTVDEFPAGTVLVFLAIYIAFACYTNGTAVSSGLVVPMLVIGASIGRLFGLGLVKGFASGVDGPAYRNNQSWMDPGLYALVGAGAFFSGCTRMMISVCVIMVELSGDLHYLLPVMLAIVASKIVADYCAKPLYHAQLHLDNVPFLPSSWDEGYLEEFTAADVMTKAVVTLREVELTAVVVAALRSNRHHAFPIVRHLPDGRRKFVGMATREDLLMYLALPVLSGGAADATGDAPASPLADRPLTRADLAPRAQQAAGLDWEEWQGHQASLFLHSGSRRWQAIWEQRLERREDDDFVSSLPPALDLSLITNRSPYVVPPFFNLSLTYGLFRSVGLRHLVVIDGGTVLGLITRKDLLHFVGRAHHVDDPLGEASPPAARPSPSDTALSRVSSHATVPSRNDSLVQQLPRAAEPHPLAAVTPASAVVVMTDGDMDDQKTADQNNDSAHHKRHQPVSHPQEDINGPAPVVTGTSTTETGRQGPTGGRTVTGSPSKKTQDFFDEFFADS